MIIKDVNGKERTIQDNLKVVSYNRKNDVTAFTPTNIEGELVQVPEVLEVESDERFVEVEIIGKRRKWTEWYPLEIFERMNPEIKVMV